MATGGGSFRIDVPNLDNTITEHTEFRKRAMLFKARLKLEKKENQAAIMLLGDSLALPGTRVRAWLKTRPSWKTIRRLIC